MTDAPEHHPRSPLEQGETPGQEWQTLSHYDPDTDREVLPRSERKHGNAISMALTDEEYSYVRHLCAVQNKSIESEVRASSGKYLKKVAGQTNYGDIARRRFAEAMDGDSPLVDHTLETPEQVRSAGLDQIAATRIMNFENSEEKTPEKLRVMMIRFTKEERSTLDALAMLEQKSILQVIRSALGEHLDELVKQPNFGELVEAYEKKTRAADEEFRRRLLTSAEQEGHDALR